jgi:hypothetical protein
MKNRKDQEEKQLKDCRVGGSPLALFVSLAVRVLVLSMALFMHFMSFMVRLGDLDDLGALRVSARKGLWVLDCAV